MNRFALGRYHWWLSGVCSGIAYAFHVPARRVRLAFFLLTPLTLGAPIALYAFLATFFPNWDPEPKDFGSVIGEP